MTHPHRVTMGHIFSDTNQNQKLDGRDILAALQDPIRAPAALKALRGFAMAKANDDLAVDWLSDQYQALVTTHGSPEHPAFKAALAAMATQIADGMQQIIDELSPQFRDRPANQKQWVEDQVLYLPPDTVDDARESLQAMISVVASCKQTYDNSLVIFSKGVALTENEVGALLPLLQSAAKAGRFK